METVFRVGMTVYDEVFQKGQKGEITDIETWNREYLGDMKVLIVSFGCSSYTYSIRGALLAFGSLKLNYVMPVTLSTSPYTIGEIKQEPAPHTLHDAVTWCKENYDGFRENLCGKYIDDEYELAFDALNSLIILRELYNEGWVPDWSDVTQEKFVIFASNYELQKGVRFKENENLYFKSEEIRDKFFEEQSSLLKEASILL